MCRQELEITQREHILAILENAHMLHLALSDDDYPYIVPVNYAYDWQEQNLFFYIYGTKQGKKMSLLERNQKIGFELDYSPISMATEQAEIHQYPYRSLVGQGLVSMLSDLKEKKYALLKIIEQETGKDMEEIPDSKIQNTEIIKIEVVSMITKQGK